jgi:alpha-L-rhamnosidase
MKKLILLFVYFLSISALRAQVVQELNLPKPQYAPQKWKGSWITHPDIADSDYGVVNFRRTFELKEKPNQFIVNLTADNQYRLFVNGKFVNFGPQLSDVRHWRYETIDLASFLQVGKNVIAVEVINWGTNRFYGIMSTRTALAINGFSPNTDAANTDGDNWKVYHNKAFRENYPNWVFAKDIIGGFYASNPADSVLAEKYPWGWQNLDYDDSKWEKAKWIWSVSTNTTSFFWIVEPRNTPLQTSKLERFTKVARNEGVTVSENFLKGNQPLTIPANTKASFLIDQTYVTIGYPEMKLSGGKNASIRLTYAENMFDAKRQRGNRNDLNGKIMLGIKDTYILDGGKDRMFKPLWLRTFRFIQVEIQTQSEPLILQDYYNVYWSAPLEKIANFQSDHKMYDKIMDICWRTNIICVQDNFLSDAYYEQMQYVGDTRVHALTNMYLTGNDLHFRNALIQFDYSRMHDGNLMSCYPLKGNFGHATYSLIWIDMLWDYMMHRDDRQFLARFVIGIRHVLDGFDVLIKENGIVGDTQWKYFIDWYTEGKKGGMPPNSADGNSAVVTLHYVYTLQRAAEIFNYLGKKEEAAKYTARANEIKTKVYALCFDEKKSVFAEHPEKDFYDQRANIMAVLTDAMPENKQKELISRLVQDSTLSQAGYYYRFNFFNALTKTNTGDLFDEVVKPWYQLVEKGLSTTPERPIHERSEAHPWSTAPAYAYFSVLAGITPNEIGFKSVKIAPAFGILKEMKGSYPHYLGNIEFDFKKTRNGGIEGFVTLPKGLKGIFVWQGKTMNLNEGKQKVN